MAMISKEGTPFPTTTGKPEKTPFRINRKAALAGGIVLTVAGAIAGIRGRGEEQSATTPSTDAPISRQIDKPESGNTVQVETPKNSQIAPEFQMKTIDGRTIDSKDYKGKPLVILYFGDAGWKDAAESTKQVENAVKNSKDSNFLVVVYDPSNAKPLEITSPIVVDEFVTNEKTGSLSLKFLRALDRPGASTNLYPITVFIDRQWQITDRIYGTPEISQVQNSLKTIDTPK